MKTTAKFRNKMLRCVRLTVIVLSMTILLRHLAWCSSAISFAYDPIAELSPGSSNVVTALVLNSGSDDVSLFSDSSQIVSGPGSIDSSPYFHDITIPYYLGNPVSLTPGEEIDFPLFDIDVSPSALPGEAIDGIFDIYGKNSSGQTVEAGEEYFSTTVAGAVVSPELSPWAALAALLTSGALWRLLKCKGTQVRM